MPKDYSNKNLQKAFFKDEYLGDANFTGSDLRGANFCGSDLTGANFTHVKTGITVINTILLFIPALVFSLISAMLRCSPGKQFRKCWLLKTRK